MSPAGWCSATPETTGSSTSWVCPPAFSANQPTVSKAASPSPFQNSVFPPARHAYSQCASEGKSTSTEENHSFGNFSRSQVRQAVHQARQSSHDTCSTGLRPPLNRLGCGSNFFRDLGSLPVQMWMFNPNLLTHHFHSSCVTTYFPSQKSCGISTRCRGSSLAEYPREPIRNVPAGIFRKRIESRSSIRLEGNGTSTSEAAPTADQSTCSEARSGGSIEERRGVGLFMRSCPEGPVHLDAETGLLLPEAGESLVEHSRGRRGRTSLPQWLQVSLHA